MENKIEIAKIDTTTTSSYIYPQKNDGNGKEKTWQTYIRDLRDNLRVHEIDVAYTLNKTPDGIIYGIIYEVANRGDYEQILIFFKDGSTCNSGSHIKNALDKLKNAVNNDAINDNEVKNIYDEIGKHCGDSSFINFKNEQEKNDKIGFVFCTSDQDIETFLKYPNQKECNDCKIVLAYKHGSSNGQVNDNEKYIEIGDVKRYWWISKPLGDGVSLPGTQQIVYEGDQIKVRYSKQGCEDVVKDVDVYDNYESPYYKIDNNKIIFKSAEEARIPFDRKVNLQCNGVKLDHANILLDGKGIKLHSDNYIKFKYDGKEHKLTIKIDGYKDYSVDIKPDQTSISIELEEENKIEKIMLPNGKCIKVIGKKQDIKYLKEIIDNYKNPSNRRIPEASAKLVNIFFNHINRA